MKDLGINENADTQKNMIYIVSIIFVLLVLIAIFLGIVNLRRNNKSPGLIVIRNYQKEL